MQWAFRMKDGMKQTEVGWIPDDWDVTTLGNCGEVVIGLTYKPEDVAADGTLVLRSSNIHNARLDFRDCVFVQMDLPERVKVRKNDLLICVRNGSKKLIGKCALITDAVAGQAFGAFMTVFRASNNRYLFQVFQSNLIQYQIQNNLGATINQITNKDLKSYWVALPSPDEQQAIAEALSDADAYIESLEALIEKKRLIKQGAMQELLKPKEGWEQTTFDEAFYFLRTASYSRADLASGGYAGYIHYGDIHTKWSNLLDIKKAKKLPTISEDMLKAYSLVKSGDIIMADASEDYLGVGKSIEIVNDDGQKIVAGLHTFLLRQKSNLFSPKFLGYFIHSKYIKAQIDTLATGLKVYSISKSALKQVYILYPDADEQTRIADILYDIDNEIENLIEKLSKARQIKQGMMQQLLTGKIRLVNKAKVKTDKTLKRVVA